ncbi:MAG: hypothetical protein RIT24_1366, partial [Planctomycetota bacterium]
AQGAGLACEVKESREWKIDRRDDAVRVFIVE